MTNLRIGFGTDLHRLIPGKFLILGGISIPSLMRCQAHSDGDTLLHALIDALLGAANLGDIGDHFSDLDPKFQGISSTFFLEKCLELLQNNFYSIVNIDAVITLENPKLYYYKDSIRKNLALLLKICSDRISIKAKTHEQVDALEKNPVITAQVIILLEKG